MRGNTGLVVFLAMLNTVACSQSGSDATSATDISGYIHTLNHSRFVTGTVLQQVDESGMHKVIGRDGTFATYVGSKAAIGVPNEAVPNDATTYFPNETGQQDAEVQAYLLSNGLPGNQIASFSSKFVGLARVSMDAGVDSSMFKNTTNSGWFSILDRMYDSVPIVDSFAWAILDSAGASVEEQVYWPEIGADVVASLRRFQSLLNDPGMKDTFINSLPSGIAAGQLVIRHTAWDWQGTFDAQPCYRASFGTATLYFDIARRIVQLPDGT